MSQSDVDAAIGWDESTGEISLGGKKIGRPDALVGGSSYWKDTSVLDNAFSDYVSRTGKTMPTSTTVSTGNEDVMEKYKRTFETAMNENPYETEVGKSIMGKYNLAAIQGRENQLASGAATNGGNIDSFSAANAMRQQAALIYQGQDAALSAHQQKIDNAQKILEGMGVHINRMFEQDETAKNNEVSRNVAKSEVTGYVPTEWTYDNNIYLNSDGTVRDEYLTDEFDATGGFTTIINDAKAKLATTTDATERASLQATINAATQAKALKTFSSPKYAKYAHEVTATTPQETAAIKQANADRESAETIALSGNESNVKQAEIAAGATLGAANIEAKNNLDMLDKQIEAGVLETDDEETYNTFGGEDENDAYKLSEDVIEGLVTKEKGKEDVINNDAGVDRYGQKLLKKIRDNILPEFGGVINFSDEADKRKFAERIAKYSSDCYTDSNQIKRVLMYLGIDTVIVDTYLEDVGGEWNGDASKGWANGVRMKVRSDDE